MEGGKRKGVGEVREGQGQAEVVQFKKFFYKYNTIQINFYRALHVNSQASLERCDGAKTVTNSKIETVQF